MTIREYFITIETKLQAHYPEPEAKEMVYCLFDFYLKLSKVDIALEGLTKVAIHDKIEDAAKRLVLNEPLQYILREAYFCDLVFEVDSNVLIPRPETEELVSMIVNDNSILTPSILEIGTGSGCIPISLKHMIPSAKVAACDISHEALKLAQRNAVKNKQEVDFFHCDILNVTDIPEAKYDIIVSNPPYICEDERVLMRANVLDYEPDLALFVPNDDALKFYEAIAKYALLALKKGGAIYYEINEAYGAEMIQLMKSLGYIEVLIHADIFGKERMMRAVKA